MAYRDSTSTSTTITLQPHTPRYTWVCWNQRPNDPLSILDRNSAEPELTTKQTPKSPSSISSTTSTSRRPISASIFTKLIKLVLAAMIFIGTTYGEGMIRALALVALFVVYVREIG
ncbi:hypothetical protein JR316_0000126 [Psilocybe cubensis]|uniref:Uncharacterized protein n=2 Tax=Psilocybe cubensis TaxID=181762 RepID=A0ACB8HED5_PSICU|nr:hypothetical protein JR316_0000126 [Psilocybe cubensis]KAH9486062.1 hypothetical protein JR316_0000126 [Psilocybe cubensis]